MMELLKSFVRFGKPKPWEMDFPTTAAASDIVGCFRLLLGRLPSRAEWPGHSLQIGEELSQVVGTFLNSPEFANRHLLQRKPENVQLVDLGRFKMYASPDDTFIGKEIIQTHNHEPRVTAAFIEHIKPGMGVLDVGANIGYYTMLAASLTGSTGVVYALEPSPDNVKMLCASQAANGFHNIRVLQAAAADAPVLLRYFRSRSNGVVAPLVNERGEDIFLSETVIGVRIDDNLPRDANIGFMKIDVEGFEFMAVSGALHTIERNRPLIVIEFSPPGLRHSSGVSGEEYLQLFLDLGYQPFVLDDVGPIHANKEQVMSHFEQSGTDHIDVLLKPERSPGGH